MYFIIVTTPPKQILDQTQTLIESSCVPSALLHFGCDEKIGSNLIKDEFLQKLSSGSGAKKVLGESKNHVKENQEDEVGGSSSNSAKSSVPKNFMASKASSSTSGNVPKWFKFGK